MRLCATISSCDRYQKRLVRNFQELQVSCSSFAKTKWSRHRVIVFFFHYLVVTRRLTMNPVFPLKKTKKNTSYFQVFHELHPALLFPVVSKLCPTPSHPDSEFNPLCNQNTCIYLNSPEFIQIKKKKKQPANQCSQYTIL